MAAGRREVAQHLQLARAVLLDDRPVGLDQVLARNGSWPLPPAELAAVTDYRLKPEFPASLSVLELGRAPTQAAAETSLAEDGEVDRHEDEPEQPTMLASRWSGDRTVAMLQHEDLIDELNVMAGQVLPREATALTRRQWEAARRGAAEQAAECLGRWLDKWAVIYDRTGAGIRGRKGTSHSVLRHAVAAGFPEAAVERAAARIAAFEAVHQERKKEEAEKRTVHCPECGAAFTYYTNMCRHRRRLHRR